MLEYLTIENYKSIHDLNLKLGRVNVFIGENGCGKSNILESIALAGAAESGKLDREFLIPRGIRATEPNTMASLFEENNDAPIILKTREFNSELVHTYSLVKDDNTSYPNLVLKYDEDEELKIKSEIREGIENQLKTILSTHKRKRANLFKEMFENDETLSKIVDDFYKSGSHLKKKKKTGLADFLIYSPENSALRNFYKEGQIEPLGINGEGLLKLVKVLSDKYPDDIEVVKKSLSLFGWYNDFKIPEVFNQQHNRIKVSDKFIKCTDIDQRSANEGFLFILFYISLIVSRDTPSIFAVDNIDASLNPRLCTKLIEDICNLSLYYDKQLFLTTHNPAILDGLDLNDPMQKLFVVSRNRRGHTRVKEILASDKPKSSSGEPIKLSEAMLRGYIGGLPEGF